MLWMFIVGIALFVIVFFVIWVLVTYCYGHDWEFSWDTIERKRKEKEKRKKKKANWKEMKKKVGNIHIVEKVNENGSIYYIAERFETNPYGYKWEIFMFTGEEKKWKDSYGGEHSANEKIPIKYDTSKEAQEAANEKLEEMGRKENARTYHKVVGEFTP